MYDYPDNSRKIRLMSIGKFISATLQSLMRKCICIDIVLKNNKNNIFLGLRVVSFGLEGCCDTLICHSDLQVRPLELVRSR